MPTVALGREANERTRAARLEEYRRHGTPATVLDVMRGVHPTRALRWAPCPEVALDAADEQPSYRLEGNRTLRLIAAPGHTPGNLVALIEETRELFSGDTLIPTTIPTPGLHFPGLVEGGDLQRADRWPSLPPFLRSVAALRDLDLVRVYPGHGDVIDDPGVYIERFEGHHRRRAAQVRAALVEAGTDGATAFEVARAVFRRLPDERLGQALTEVIGHLDLLAEAGRATCGHGEAVRWKLTGGDA
jgi:glyoxylase-like metal-dependent hydrolase (beta-lactamase superfamily II)